MATKSSIPMVKKPVVKKPVYIPNPMQFQVMTRGLDGKMYANPGAAAAANSKYKRPGAANSRYKRPGAATTKVPMAPANKPSITPVNNNPLKTKTILITRPRSNSMPIKLK